MGRQRSAAARVQYHQDLHEAIRKCLPQRGLPLQTEDGRVRWTPRLLVTCVLLLGWSAGRNMQECFASARGGGGNVSQPSTAGGELGRILAGVEFSFGGTIVCGGGLFASDDDPGIGSAVALERVGADGGRWKPRGMPHDAKQREASGLCRQGQDHAAVVPYGAVPHRQRPSVGVDSRTGRRQRAQARAADGEGATASDAAADGRGLSQLYVAAGVAGGGARLHCPRGPQRASVASGGLGRTPGWPARIPLAAEPPPSGSAGTTPDAGQDGPPADVPADQRAGSSSAAG